MRVYLTKLNTILEPIDRKIFDYGVLLAIALALFLGFTHFEWPGARGPHVDLTRVDATVFGFAERFGLIWQQGFSFFDPDFELGYDQSSYYRHPMNPFNFLSFFGFSLYVAFLSNIVAKCFAAVAIFSICRLLFGQNVLWVVLVCVYLTSNSFQVHGSNSNIVNSFMLLVCYVEIAVVIVGKLSLTLRHWAAMVLAPLIADLYFPIYVIFVFVMLIVWLMIHAQGRDLLDAVRAKIWAITGIVGLHVFGWLPYVSSAGGVTDREEPDLLDFGAMLEPGTFDLAAFFMEVLPFYKSILVPHSIHNVSGLFVYIPIGLAMFAFAVYASRTERDQATKIVPFGILALLMLFPFSLWLNSRYVADLIGQLSYYRGQFALMHPVAVMLLCVMVYTRWRRALVLAPILGCMLAMDLTVTGSKVYFWALMGIYGYVLTAGLLRWQVLALPLALMFSQWVYFGNNTLLNRWGVDQDRARWDGLMERMACIGSKLPRDLPEQRILMTGTSAWPLVLQRLYNWDVTHLPEAARGFDFNILYSYREFHHPELLRAYDATLGFGGERWLAPIWDAIKDTPVDKILASGVSALIVYDLPRETVEAKFASAGVTYRGSCMGTEQEFDVYILESAQGVTTSCDPTQSGTVHRIGPATWRYQNTQCIELRFAAYDFLTAWDQNGVALRNHSDHFFQLKPEQDSGTITLSGRTKRHVILVVYGIAAYGFLLFCLWNIVPTRWRRRAIDVRPRPHSPA